MLAQQRVNGVVVRSVYGPFAIGFVWMCRLSVRRPLRDRPLSKWPAGAAEGPIVLPDGVVGSKNPGNAEFVEASTFTYSTAPENRPAMGYSLALDAIKAAGPNPTREGVRDALIRLCDVSTILGGGTWATDDHDRDPRYGAAVLKMRGGTLVWPNSRVLASCTSG